MTQVLSQPPALPRMGDRLFLAGASPYSKVTAAAKRKRDYRDAGFRGSCQTCEASSKRAPDAQAAPEVRCAEVVHALGRLQAAGGARTSGLTGVPGGRPPPAGLAASSITCCMAQRRSWSAARQPAAPARARARWSAPRAGCAACTSWHERAERRDCELGADSLGRGGEPRRALASCSHRKYA